MRSFGRRGLLAILVVSGALLVVGVPSNGLAASGAKVAVLPIQNGAGDQQAAVALEQALGRELRKSAELVDRGRARRVLRRLRIRDGDDTAPDLLKSLGKELDADRLVVVTLHDAERRGTPRLAVSARAYSATTGELLWAGFKGGCGLDRQSVLGLGVVANLEGLIPQVASQLVEDFETAVLGGGEDEDRSTRSAAVDIGTLAVVPLESVTEQRRTATAETVTEAARAALFRRGIRLVPPHCASEVLRRRQGGLWGGVTVETRSALRDSCGADSILTGSVETYDVHGSRREPEPEVAIALRMVNPETGRILWTGALERRGRDRQGMFRLGRVYSRGALAERLTAALTQRLLSEWPGRATRSEENQ